MASKSALQKSKEMLDRINKRKQDQEAKKVGLKLEPGTTELRYLQFNDEGEWMVSGFFHYGFSELFLCPTTYGEDCPACEFVQPFWKGDADDEATAKRLSRKMRYFANVSRVACKKPDGEVVEYQQPNVKIHAMSEKIAVCLLDHTQNEDYGDITDPKTGRNVRITRTGKGQFDTRYGDPVPRPKSTEISNYAELQKLVVDLNEYINKSKKTKEEIENIIQNVDSEAEGTTKDVDGVEPETENPVETKASDGGWDDETPNTTKTEKKATAGAVDQKSDAPATTQKLSIKDRVRQLRQGK